MKQSLLYFILLSNFIVCGQIQVDYPKEFIEIDIPEINTDEWRELNHSSNEFEVEIFDSKLNVEKFDSQRKTELKVENGKLVGINKGEWGGKLSFIPENEDQPRIEIKKGNIKYIFEFNDKIYFIEGLAHLSYSGGAIFELIREGENFRYDKMVEFDDAPQAFTIYDNKLLIATHQNFYIVEDFEKELIFEKMFWSSLYPNSIVVIDSENVFMGIRGGFVKLDLNNKNVNFYKYTG